MGQKNVWFSVQTTNKHGDMIEEIHHVTYPEALRFFREYKARYPRHTTICRDQWTAQAWHVYRP